MHTILPRRFQVEALQEQNNHGMSRHQVALNLYRPPKPHPSSALPLRTHNEQVKGPSGSALRVLSPAPGPSQAPVTCPLARVPCLRETLQAKSLT